MPQRGSRVPGVDIVQLVRRFEPSVPAAAKAITEEIWTEIPGYAAIRDPHFRGEVEEATARNVAAFIRALGEGHDLPKKEIDALAVVGEQRAHQGIPIEDVLRAFRTVGRVLWDYFSKELTGPNAPPMEVAVELSRTLMRFTDQIASAVAYHFSVAQRSIVRQQEAARREFLHDLLLGTYVTTDDMVKRSRGFGYDLARPHVGVVVEREGWKTDAAKEELDLSRALDRLSERISLAGQPMVDRRGGQTIGVFPLAPGVTADTAQIGQVLIEELGEDWKVGVGGPYSGLEGCRRSYVEAREALEIGSILDEDRRVYPFDDFLMYRFLRADGALAERFVDSVIGPIVEHDRKRRSELIKTLDAYFATDGSAKEAGRRLYAHPHTITYRLKQIERLTGRSLRNPEDKLHLHLAVKALRLLAGRVAEAGEGELSSATTAN